MKKYLFCFLLPICFISFACGTSTKFKIADNKIPEELSICIRYNQEINTNIITAFNNALPDLIAEYNAEGNRFNIAPCKDEKSNALVIYIEQTRLIAPWHQGLAVGASIIGLSIPFILVKAESPIIFGFIYYPQNSSSAILNLSRDIDGSSQRYFSKRFGSFPYFGSTKTQIKRQTAAFKTFILQTLRNLERETRK